MESNRVFLLLFMAIRPIEYTFAIINGHQADIGDFPYVASLQRLMHGHRCGGAIISSRFILTAAHCFDNQEESHWVIKIGIVRVNDWYGKRFPVKKFHRHPGYEPFIIEKLTAEEMQRLRDNGYQLDIDEITVKEAVHDIAIVESDEAFSMDLPKLPLRTDQEFQEDVNYQIAIIKRIEKRPDGCTICVFPGWGSTTDAGTKSVSSTYLQYLIIRIHNGNDCCQQQCQQAGDIFCGLHPSRNAAVASGDSGSPLICEGFLVAILSSSYSYLFESFYVDVVYHKDWIDSIIGNS